MTLTEEQRQRLAEGDPIVIIVDGSECVLQLKDAFDQDDSFTDEEINLLADESAAIIASTETLDHFDEP